MTARERRASLSLALIFALRMLGLFLVLPVFALEARHYPGGDNAALVGLAMGAYGMTQAVLQLPLGLASDWLGRKRVIVGGLLVFAAGSLLAAWADTLMGLLLGRAVQGAGAVSAATMALLADQTRDAVRTKAMALVGMSIGLMFALALVLAPLLNARLGLSGLFGFIGALALAGVAVVLWVVPPEDMHGAIETLAVPQARGRLADVWNHADLLRLNAGVFVLHAVQMSMWVAVPTLLVQAGLPAAAHWQVYLPAVALSFAAMGALFALERRGRLPIVLRLAVGLVLVVQMGFGLLAGSGTTPTLAALGALLFVFFCGFNVLEATQPSLVSRMAPKTLRGAALGTYNTLQSLGLFVGGALGGALARWVGMPGLFAATAALALLWLVLVWPLRPMQRDQTMH